MPYLTHNHIISLQMISVFVVLGIVLLAVPIVCALFVVFSKLKQKKRAEIVKNATSTTTTVKKGSNGRTIFETSTIKSSPPRAATRDPVLPFTQQQASKASRPISVKNTWQRLSRPFSNVPIAYEDDEIELTQTKKQRPAPHSSRFQENISTEPISPVSPPSSHRMGSTSSWNTIDGLDSSPVSPVSITGLPAPSSGVRADPSAYRSYQHHQPHQSCDTVYSEIYKVSPYSNVASQSPSNKDDKSQKTRAGTGLSSARSFVASTVKEQVLTDANKAKAKQAVMSAAEAAGHCAPASVEKGVVDGKHMTTNVQLSQPPRAKLAGSRR